RALEPNLCVLHAGRVRGVFFASFETSGVRYSPDKAIRLLATALLGLPAPLQKLWKQAGALVFDIGLEKARGTTAFTLFLQSDTVKLLAGLEARVAITLYARLARN